MEIHTSRADRIGLGEGAGWAGGERNVYPTRTRLLCAFSYSESIVRPTQILSGCSSQHGYS
jgi:hypothetical protein